MTCYRQHFFLKNCVYTSFSIPIENAFKLNISQAVWRLYSSSTTFSYCGWLRLIQYSRALRQMASARWILSLFVNVETSVDKAIVEQQVLTELQPAPRFPHVLKRYVHRTSPRPGHMTQRTSRGREGATTELWNRWGSKTELGNAWGKTLVLHPVTLMCDNNGIMWKAPSRQSAAHVESAPGASASLP